MADAEAAVEPYVSFHYCSVRFCSTLSRLRLAQREYDAAVSDFRRAVSVASELAPAHYYCGATLLLSGKSEDAKKALQSAVALSPNYADAVFQLTELRLRTNEADAARSSVERFIETNPKSVKAHVLLGAALAAIGRARESSEAFQQILQIQPNSAEGHCWLGMGFDGRAAHPGGGGGI